MSWFERHLNWSFFFGCFLIPAVVSVIMYVLFLPQFYSGFLALVTSEPSQQELMEYILNTTMQFVAVFSIVGLVLWIFMFIITWWYLGKKARSKWFILLHFAPFGIIVLLLLENQTPQFEVDISGEAAMSGWSDTGPLAAPDDRLYKELDYSPDKKVVDILGNGAVKDSGVAKDVAGIVDVSPAGTTSPASPTGEEMPAPSKVVERTVTTERLQSPILLDDAGAVIGCFYHPGADAVNMCSRCKQYVCIDCNYITGTHPICRNCWGKRAEVPIAPPAHKKSPAPIKPAKQKAAEPTTPPEPIVVEPIKPPEPIVMQSTKPSEPTVVEPIKPPEPIVMLSARPPEPIVEPIKPPEQIVMQSTKPPEQIVVESAKPEPPTIAAPAKSAKLEAEKSQWLLDFIAMYEQASPIITVVTSRSADGMPASPLDLMEGLKLRPMLERAKKISKPKDKELRQVKSEFEQVLSSCIKIADAAANFVSSGGQALLGGPDFARIVKGIETADGLVEKLTSRLATLS